MFVLGGVSFLKGYITYHNIIPFEKKGFADMETQTKTSTERIFATQKWSHGAKDGLDPTDVFSLWMLVGTTWVLNQNRGVYPPKWMIYSGKPY